MKLKLSIIAILITLAFIGNAIATGPARNVVYPGGGAGQVTFNGAIHAKAGLSCTACHPGLFQMARTAKITMEDHNRGTSCFSCHRAGGSAFPHTNNCAKCHKK